MSAEVFNLDKGLQGYYVNNDRFNTTLLSYNFYLPLKGEDMAKNALLPYLLTTCCEKYRDYIELNFRLLELYGADLSCRATKLGDLMHIQFSVSVVNDEFAFGDEKHVAEASALMAELIFHPSVKDGAFMPSDLEREKRKTIEKIEGEINNKRSYAMNRLISEMFKGRAYGRFIYGEADEVAAITAGELFSAWEKLLDTAYIRINVVGRKLDSTVFETAKAELQKRDRRPTELCENRPLEPTESVETVVERMDITQGKLAMGFAGGMCGGFLETAPFVVFSDLFGGGPYSKLFANVREKKSLCYYCSASARRAKGIMTVASGIEEENADTVVEAVLLELEDMKAGRFDDETLACSKKAITDTLYGYYDSAAALDIWYSKEMGGAVSPEEAIEAIEKVSREDVIAVADRIKLHTVYKLLPREGE